MKYTEKQAKNFIEYIAPMIKAEAAVRGYKVCSTAIAQAIVEGAAGTSDLAKIYHNHFGMKSGKYWTGKSVKMRTKEEYVKGVLTTIYDNFRAYNSDKLGIEGYYEFINSKRYMNLRTAENALQYAQFLKFDGWATSSVYVNTLIRTVNKYGLECWDVHEPINYKIGNTYICTANMNVRNEPSTGSTDSILFVIPSGSIVICDDVIKKDGFIWVQIPADPKNNRMLQYICADNGVKSYLKESMEVL